MKTLIAYATKHGCAEKCAQILAAKLAGEVDLCNLKAVKDVELSKYNKVVIGGSIYMGKVQKEVIEFCSQNLKELRDKKLGLFICGMLPSKVESQFNNSFSSELLSIALVKEFLGGQFKFKKLNAVEKFMVKMVANSEESLPAIDMKNDVSTISDERINKLAHILNNAS